MDNSAIEHIYYSDNGGLYESIKNSEEYVKINSKCLKLYEKLRDTLNDEQKKELDNLYNLLADLECEAVFVRFKAGLKFGLRLAAECLT